MKFRLALFVVVAVGSGPAAANYCAAPLSRTNTTITGVVNTYYPITADITAGTTIQIGTGRGAAEDLRVGDLILLWIPQTMQAVSPNSNDSAALYGAGGGAGTGQGWSALNHSGKFQWLRVSGGAVGDLVKAAGNVGNTTITVSNGGGGGPFGQLAYNSGGTSLRSAQIVRVPQYGNATINGTVTAAPYRETATSGALGPQSTGGIVALDVAGTLTFSPGAKIDVSEMGFRGGAGQQLNGSATGNVNMINITRWYGYSATDRPFGGVKGEGGVGTPFRVYHQGALQTLDWTAHGSVSPEGYGSDNGTNAPGSAMGRAGLGNAGGGATDQCPYTINVSSSTGTMCRNGTVTYLYNRLNPGGGGGGGWGSGGKGADHDYDGDGAVAPSGGGLGGKGVSSLTDFVNDAQPPTPAGFHQYAMLGGGGGAGSTNANSPGDLQSSGATGGGVILIRSGRIAGSGQLLANGGDAQNVSATDPNNPAGTNSGQGNGAGGGGGGGWILASARLASTPTLSYSAKGGKGGNANGGMGGGGGGGGGYVGTSTTLPASGADVSGGAAGTTSGTPTRATNLAGGLNATAASGAAAGVTGSTGQFPASGLSVPSTTAMSNIDASSSSVAPGPQCVPFVTKEFSTDGGTTWLSTVNRAANQTFKMRLSIENPNVNAFTGGAPGLPELYEQLTFTDSYNTNNPAGSILNATPVNVSHNNCGSPTITATAGQPSLAVSGNAAIAGATTCVITADLIATAPGTFTNTIPRESVIVKHLVQVVGEANAVVLQNYEDVTATVIVPAGITASKTSAIVSDPVNNTTNPKRIPGSSVDYTIAIANPTPTALDNNTMILSDSLPTTTRLFVGNLTGGAPFEFTAGSSNLTCPFVSLADQNDCIDFSTDGVDWTYVPTASGDGTDAAVRFVRFRTTGSMAISGNFSVRYRVIVR